MSWQADCRYFNFTEDAIRTSAPQESGVYGLYNFNYQIFIGESENIQEALLRHQRETDFQFPRYRPSGFTFEICPANARKRRAHDLIEKYRPLLQIETEFIDQRSPTANAIEQPTFRGSFFGEYKINNHEFSAEEHVSQQPMSRRSFFAGAQHAKPASMYLLSAAVIFYLGVLTGENLQERAKAKSEDSLSRMAQTLSSAQHASSDSKEEALSAVNLAGNVPNPSIGWMPAQLEIPAPSSTLAGQDRVQGASGVMGSGLVSPPAKSNPTTQPVVSSDRSKQWSVQIFSAPVKQVSDSLAQRLVADGHNGYVVRAEVRGQTYFRVRVGHFAAQGEAESLRQLLAGEAGYRDAFLALD